MSALKHRAGQLQSVCSVSSLQVLWLLIPHLLPHSFSSWVLSIQEMDRQQVFVIKTFLTLIQPQEPDRRISARAQQVINSLHWGLAFPHEVNPHMLSLLNLYRRQQPTQQRLDSCWTNNRCSTPQAISPPSSQASYKDSYGSVKGMSEFPIVLQLNCRENDKANVFYNCEPIVGLVFLKESTKISPHS